MALARLSAFFALVVFLAPTATAHIDVCFEGACVYEWDWNWGEGSCDGGDPWFWSHRVVSASAPLEGERHSVRAETYCYDYEDGHAGSSVHIGYETRGPNQTQSWAHVDWYGSDTPESSSCTVRYWAYNQDVLPGGTVTRECPMRPPLPRS